MSRKMLTGLLVLALLSGVGGSAQAGFGVPEVQARPGADKSHPLRHDLALVNRWGLSTGASSYAGAYYYPRRGGVLVVGFTDHPGSNTAKVRALPGILDPDRLVPRGKVARYTLQFLRRLEARLLREVVQAPGGRLIAGWRINLRGNSLLVKSEHVHKAQEVLKAKFGDDAPIVVRYGERSVLA